MNDRRVVTTVNSNYHRLTGEDLFTKNDDRFREYRKCWKEWPEKFITGASPLFIDIETTSVCNLSCPFCATTFRGSRIKKGFIQYDVVTKIIDEGAANGLYGVKFNIRGEPLLHPRIHDMVRYAKEKGLIDVYFNTNGMPLTEEMSGKLIDAGLDRISISFEGCTKAIYEQRRVGAVFETVVSNIERLQALKKRLGISHPKVRVQAVSFSDVVRTFDEYTRFWSQRADEVGLLDYKEMKGKKEGIRYPWACPQLWQRMAVWWDGTLLPCNHDDDGLIALGTVQEMTIKEAWDSRRLHDIRKAHREGLAHTIPACDGCYLRDSEILKLQEKEEKKK